MLKETQTFHLYLRSVLSLSFWVWAADKNLKYGVQNPTTWGYLCITGQLGRLELHNKLEKLVKPLAAAADKNLKYGVGLRQNPTHNKLEKLAKPLAAAADKNLKYDVGLRQNTTTWGYLCITGQLGRLELHNKLEKLVKPLAAKFSRVHVGLAMDDINKTLQFVNPNGSTSLVANFTFDSVKRYLMLAGATSVAVYTPRHDENVSLNEYYIRQLDKKEMNPKQRERRARGHVRQFEALAACGLGLEYFPQPPSMVVRIRDDVMVLNMNLKGLETVLKNAADAGGGNLVITPRCASNFGMSDKVAVVSASAAVAYFASPLRWYHSRIGPIINPETYYMHIYKKKAGLNLTATSSLLNVGPSRLRMRDGCKRYVPRWVEKNGVSACEIKINMALRSAGLPCTL